LPAFIGRHETAFHVGLSRLWRTKRLKEADMTETNPIAYPIEEIPAVVGVPRTKIFQAIRERRLTARKVGRSTIITHDDLMAGSIRCLQRAKLRPRRHEL
jgi:hypothetical protein